MYESLTILKHFHLLFECHIPLQIYVNTHKHTHTHTHISISVTLLGDKFFLLSGQAWKCYHTCATAVIKATWGSLIALSPSFERSFSASDFLVETKLAQYIQSPIGDHRISKCGAVDTFRASGEHARIVLAKELTFPDVKQQAK